MTETTKPLSKREREALEEFRNMPDNKVFFWNVRSMEKLAERGLVKRAVCPNYRATGFAITPAGRAALEGGA